jgi:hypothetical protein
MAEKRRRDVVPEILLSWHLYLTHFSRQAQLNKVTGNRMKGVTNFPETPYQQTKHRLQPNPGMILHFIICFRCKSRLAKTSSAQLETKIAYTGSISCIHLF